MKKVLIIGGTGLLGQHSAVALINKGYEPVLISRKKPDKLLDGLDNLQIIQADVKSLRVEELISLFKGHYGLVYALGPDDREIHKAPALKFSLENLTEPTVRVMKAADLAGIEKAVICGSYFSAWMREKKLPELMDRHPYIYARERQALDSIASVKNMSVCILEIPYVFGTAPGVKPIWRTWLFDRLKAMPLVMYPVGGSAVVTAKQCGQALAGLIEKGEHGGRYPISWKNLSWNELLKIILPHLGKSSTVINVPRFLSEFAAIKMDKTIKNEGKEAGVNPRWLMRDIMYRFIYFDSEKSMAQTGFLPDDLEKTIEETIEVAMK